MKPDRTFTDKLTLGKGKDQIDLYYFGAGHTNGDAFVVFPALRAMCVGDLMAWKMAPLIDPATGGSVIALPDTLEKAVKGIKNVDTVIEGHGDVNTWAGFRDYTRFNRALLDAAKAGLGKQTPEEIAASLKPKFPVFTKEELLPDMEYGGTPLSRAVINVNVAFQELQGRAGDHELRPAACGRTAGAAAPRPPPPDSRAGAAEAVAGPLRPPSPLPERDRHPALGAVHRAGDGRAVGRELAGKRPRLRVGELEVQPPVLHREVAQRLVDRRRDLAAERLQIGADQFALHRAVRRSS